MASVAVRQDSADWDFFSEFEKYEDVKVTTDQKIRIKKHKEYMDAPRPLSELQTGMVWHAQIVDEKYNSEYAPI